jgi:hypothetical protein
LKLQQLGAKILRVTEVEADAEHPLSLLPKEASIS